MSSGFSIRRRRGVISSVREEKWAGSGGRKGLENWGVGPCWVAVKRWRL